MRKKNIVIFCFLLTLLVFFIFVFFYTYYLDFNQNLKYRFYVEENINILANISDEEEYSVDQETTVTAKLSIPYLEDNGREFVDAQNFIDAKATINGDGVVANVNGNRGEVSREVFEDSFYFSFKDDWEGILNQGLDQNSIEKNENEVTYTFKSESFSEKFQENLVDFFVGSMKSQGILKNDDEYELVEKPDYSIQLLMDSRTNELKIIEKLNGELSFIVNFNGKNLDQNLIKSSKDTSGTVVLKNISSSTIIEIENINSNIKENSLDFFFNYLLEKYKK